MKLDKNSDEFGTPQELWDELHKEFSFTCDAAASKENAKLPKFVTKEMDAFTWNFSGQRIWCNPPYNGAGTVRKWVQLMEASVSAGAKLAVMLVPTKTEQEWFHGFLGKRSNEVRFCRGRLKFIGGESTARDSHMVLVIKPERKFT